MRMRLRRKKRKKIREIFKKRRRKKCMSGIAMRRNKWIKHQSWVLGSWSWSRKKSRSCRSSSIKNKFTAKNLKKRSKVKHNKYWIKQNSFRFRRKHWKTQTARSSPKQKRCKKYRNSFNTSKHNTRNVKTPWHNRSQPHNKNRTNSTKLYRNSTVTTNFCNPKLMMWVNSWRIKLMLSSNRNLLLGSWSRK